MRHPVKLTRHSRHRKPRPSGPSWPSYKGISQLAGVSSDGRTTVYYDPSLGLSAVANADALVADANRVTAANDSYFGVVGGKTNVIIFALGGMTDGTGGADHMGCDFATGNNIEVCAAFGQPMMCSALFEAELSECSMNNNLCGLSTGEALSRWCSLLVSNNALAEFDSAPTWAQDGMPDFVNVTDQTDQNYDSIGCGMAFISWLMSLGYKFTDIAPSMVGLGNAGTLADLYAAMTGDAGMNALPTFLAAVNALPPPGIVSDDPFGAALLIS